MRYLRNHTGELSGALAATGGQRTFDRYLIMGALIALIWMLVMPNPLQAALIGMEASPGSPDIFTTGTAINYDYVSAGAGGQLTISSYATDDKVVQTIKVPAGSTWGTASETVWAIRDPSATGGSTAWKRTGYELIANFDGAGVFTDGTVTITGAVDAAGGFGDSTVEYAKPFDPTLPGPCFENCSGWGGSPAILLQGNLTGFGFKAEPDATGNHDALQIEWFMDVVGGDFATAGFYHIGQRTDIGVIASGLVTWGDGLTAADNGSFGAWDPLDNNTTTAFLEDFRSCDPGAPGPSGGRCEVLVDTFVPVPAAVWLFGSGLIGLFGFGARNRARNRLAA